ncbi:hypothetical protein GCK72_021214 [Caenorhabditis remanei]|uniref:SPK domain-containing protein n=1 Tax=Caenorhabditis remanei TaxID=31234 RepID=A0A6A5GJ73_CAERE|nr:hypothetical protein GCK72_021214 [Caenorhabditis remanei]KAF1754651.1 hypothetical protein GCK72_021214 [Caenorhabditis remanei]
MSNYQKYPVHESKEITNFLQFPSPEFIAYNLHTIDDLECLIAVNKRDDSSAEILIHLDASNEIKRVRARYFLGMFNETDKELISWEEEKEADIDGFLCVKPWTVPQPNKPFTFKFGLHVSAIMGMDKVWKFNFYDPLFNAANDSKMTVFIERNNPNVRFYTHKELMIFHWSELSPMQRKEIDGQCIIPPWISMNMLEKCLQIAHGVQVHCSLSDLYKISLIAKGLVLKNVIDYCERRYIEHLNQVEITEIWFHSTFMGDCRHLLNIHVVSSVLDLSSIRSVRSIARHQKSSLKSRVDKVTAQNYHQSSSLSGIYWLNTLDWKQWSFMMIGFDWFQYERINKKSIYQPIYGNKYVTNGFERRNQKKMAPFSLNDFWETTVEQEKWNGRWETFRNHYKDNLGKQVESLNFIPIKYRALIIYVTSLRVSDEFKMKLASEYCQCKFDEHGRIVAIRSDDVVGTGKHRKLRSKDEPKCEKKEEEEDSEEQVKTIGDLYDKMKNLLDSYFKHNKLLMYCILD